MSVFYKSFLCGFKINSIVYDYSYNHWDMNWHLVRYLDYGEWKTGRWEESTLRRNRENPAVVFLFLMILYFQYRIFDIFVLIKIIIVCWLWILHQFFVISRCDNQWRSFIGYHIWKWQRIGLRWYNPLPNCIDPTWCLWKSLYTGSIHSHTVILRSPTFSGRGPNRASQKPHKFYSFDSTRGFVGEGWSNKFPQLSMIIWNIEVYLSRE